MIQFKDFVPKMIAAPRLFKPGEYESFDAALAAANHWIKEHGIHVINVETVVLPNIWAVSKKDRPTSPSAPVAKCPAIGTSSSGAGTDRVEETTTNNTNSA